MKPLLLILLWSSNTSLSLRVWAEVPVGARPNDVTVEHPNKAQKHLYPEPFWLKKESVFSEIDKDGNGLVDVIEGFDEIDLLLKKHQEKLFQLTPNMSWNLFKYQII